MLKNFKTNKIISTILAAFLTLTTLAAAGCTKDNSQSQEPIVRGTHERTVSETNIDLVNNGNSNYSIFIAENAKDELISFAVNELRQNFYKATGLFLDVKTDAEVSYTESTQVLSIGENALLQQAGVTFDKSELGAAGYVVQTKGKSVFMVGGANEGSIYAVYGWLKEQF